MDKKKLIIIIVAAIAVISASLLLFSGSLTKKSVPKYDIELEIWGLFDDTDVFREAFENYKKINPNIKKINYKKFTVETYENELIEAIASSKGPDIFIIHNTWLPSFQDKMAPAPVEILNEQKFKKDFMDVAAQDFVSESNVYAVPFTIDSLSLFYNKDLFNNAGIALPPTNWDEFLEDTKILTKVDNFGNITFSGAALGTSNNINRATDILSLLIMGQGSEMERGGVAAFNNEGGKKALEFYTSFSKTSSPYYSWNSRMHNSLDAFSEGNLAMMFNYSWQIEAIKRKSPKLNFSVAPFPQVPDQTRIGYANYWGYGVSKSEKLNLDTVARKKTSADVTNQMRIAESWKLLKFMAAKADPMDYFYKDEQKLDTNYDVAAVYAEETGKPVARRDLVAMQKSDPILGVFVEQNLFAKSWKQKNPKLIEGLMSEMITVVNEGSQTIDEALRNTVAQINQSSNK